MANQLSMHKTLAITHLNQQGMSQRAIARVLGVSRGAVIRHLRAPMANSTKAPTGSNFDKQTIKQYHFLTSVKIYPNWYRLNRKWMVLFQAPIDT
jgi:IS30 family transposase